VRAGTARVETTVDGADWVLRCLPYQARCLGWLREEYAALEPVLAWCR